MAGTIIWSADNNNAKITVPAGATSDPVYASGGRVVTAIPGAGGTMLVEATWSSKADVNARTATWFSWDAGTVSAKANQILQHATAVRFTATTAAGVGEVAL